MQSKQTNNRLLIAAAGSGKTTFLVDEALKQKEGKILITTYTQANEEEIRKKIIEKNDTLIYNDGDTKKQMIQITKNVYLKI